MIKQKRINYLIKEEALKKTIEDALKLKNDLKNVSSFKDNSTNQLFMVLTSEQMDLILNDLLNGSKIKDNLYINKLKDLRDFAMQLKKHDRYETLLCQINSMIKELEDKNKK